MSTIEVGLIGNPNSGKTTLFNALTGARQHVGNWPGVTVEQKIGHFKYDHQTVKVVDLPGTYSLAIVSEEASVDERIACNYLASNQAKLMINVVDASNIERNLYLTLQLLEMGIPTIVALNMVDVARKKNILIDIDKLSRYLGCPVLPLEAVKKRGIPELKAALVAKNAHRCAIPFAYPSYLERSIDNLIQNCFVQLPRYQARSKAIRLLEEDCTVLSSLSAESQAIVLQAKQALFEQVGQETDVLIAEARYAFITDLITAVVKRVRVHSTHVTQRIDAIVLNRFLGLPIFFAVMYLMFSFAINGSGAFQDMFDSVSNTLFVEWPADWLRQWHVSDWLIMLITQGIGKGLNTVLTFVPVICGMFLFLSFLEQTGYMARAAFVVDRLMRVMGLPGKSFVPMIVGFGCNVPAVLAARTLENRRDRILTVLMSPFMSCGARLAIFAVFTAAFFPEGGATIVFVLYMIGILVAILTGLVLRKTLLKGHSAPFVLELPVYHIPHLASLWLHTWHRLKGFVWKAGQLIVPICVLLGVLNSVSVHEDPLLAIFGQWLTPIFAPMGIEQSNWPATVGLLSGILAKEVVVATLNTLYGQMGGDVMGQLYQHFDGKTGAFSYLLFVLLYFPCVSTTAAMARELGHRWAWFSVAWTTLVAYSFAVFFYQLLTFSRHQLGSVVWLSGIVVTYIVLIVGLRYVSVGESTAVPSPVCGKAALYRKRCL